MNSKLLFSVSARFSQFHVTMAFIVLIILMSIHGKAAVRQSANSGNWSTASTWSGNTVPDCGDSIIISPGHTVTISSQISMVSCTAFALVVKGELYFSGGNKLRLPCNAKIYVYSGGNITSDGAGASNRIEVCGNENWRGSDGDVAGPTCFPASPECASAMPVELSSFVATLCENNICIKWSTMTERNNSHFIIQKITGDVFTNVGQIISASPDGNSRQKLHYQWQDANADAGVNYYRLKQVDRDSTFTYSKIIVIEKKTSGEQISIWPNPSNGEFNITAFESSSITIRNTMGKTVMNQKNTNNTTIAVNGLAPGLYFCVIELGAESTVKRIVVR